MVVTFLAFCTAHIFFAQTQIYLKALHCQQLMFKMFNVGLDALYDVIRGEEQKNAKLTFSPLCEPSHYTIRWTGLSKKWINLVPTIVDCFCLCMPDNQYQTTSDLVPIFC